MMSGWKVTAAIIGRNGKGRLENSGSISHDQAIKKATVEYHKYQARTLSPVEQEYLDTVLDTTDRSMKG